MQIEYRHKWKKMSSNMLNAYIKNRNDVAIGFELYGNFPQTH